MDRQFIIEIPAGQSCFLWGARKTGKSTFLRRSFPTAYFFDLLKSEVYLRFLKDPSLLREEVLAQLDLHPTQTIFVVDEVQKVPILLDEIHWLIENTNASFILCGSSAKKLRQKGVNLLGGRAWKFHFFPLIFKEISDFNLLKCLNDGLIPSHYLSEHAQRFLKAYIEDYLILEIQAEGLVRNLSAFSKFIEMASYSNAEMINYAHIARDCGVDAKTVKEYFQILFDTLTAYEVKPYTLKSKRDIISSTSKFYFFDTGVVNYIAKKKINTLQSLDGGKSFETYILHELMAYIHYNEQNHAIYYWRTKTGLETDFIINDVPLEVKISSTVHRQDLKGILAFMEEKNVEKGYVICREDHPRKIEVAKDQALYILPYQLFLEKLWLNEIF
ncbi:MAG: DUF4143 domain-containing protein [Alphaproteobacteria bacterium]|nr:DUF4143 domain-containing protein [Alphaproteobacteria bacterium]